MPAVLIGLSLSSRVAVLNDFEANGYGVTALEPEHLVCLNEVPDVEKARICFLSRPHWPHILIKL